ncbi:MAG: TrmB family transcriptional regulator [archaeon]|nr:MAG: TrmB family transcriptional regulator [archaeon]
MINRWLKLIEKLKEAGLNEYEAKSYLALLKRGAQTGREVSKRSEVPPTRVFDTLKSLKDMGLVNLIQKKPMVWVAAKPDVGLKNFMERKLDRIKMLEKDVIKSAKELKPSPKKEKIHEKFIVVNGYHQLFDMVNHYLKKTEKEFLVYSVGEEIPYMFRIECIRALKKGVTLKVIVSKCDEENRHILKERIKEGWELKHYPGSGEYTFAVFDTKIAEINIRNPEEKEERISMFFENPELAKALREYFGTIWKKAKPIS